MSCKYILIILFAFYSGCPEVYAQVTSQKVSKKVAELRSSGVDLVVSYQVRHIGAARVIEDECDTDTIKYLFWSAGGKDFMQKFEECHEYDPLIVKSSAFLTTIRENLAAIREETIKRPVYETMINGEKHTDSTSMVMHHPTISTFKFYSLSATFTKEINHYNLDHSGGYNRPGPHFAFHSNRNFEHNQQTTLKKLLDFLETEPELVSRIK